MTVFLRKIHLNIKKNRRQIFIFVFLVSLLLAKPLINKTVGAATLWDSQTGRQEIGTVFHETDARPGDIKNVIAEFIKVLLSFLGLLMTIIIIWSGFRWMTAGGDEKKVETAKKQLTAAIIGAVIIVAAYVITYYVVEVSRKAILQEIW